MAKQDKDPDGSSSVKPGPPMPPPQTRSERPSRNADISNSPNIAPVTAETKSVPKLGIPTGLNTVRYDNPGIMRQRPPASTQHPPGKALQQPVFGQARPATTFGPPPPPDLTFNGEFVKAQDFTYDKLCEMVKDSDLDSFLEFREELLSTEKRLRPGSDYSPLKRSLQKIELAIRGAKLLEESSREANSKHEQSPTPTQRHSSKTLQQPILNQVKVTTSDAKYQGQFPSSTTDDKDNVSKGMPHFSGSPEASFFEQEFARLANSGYEDQMTEATHIMVERVSEMVDNSDLESFLRYKEESLAAEIALGSDSNYFFLKEALERLELNIRAGNTLSKLDWAINTRVPGKSAVSGAVGRLKPPEKENEGTLDVEQSKKKRRGKKKAGHEDAVTGPTKVESLPGSKFTTMKSNSDNNNPGQDNAADLEHTIEIESSLSNLNNNPDSTALLDMTGIENTVGNSDATEGLTAARDTEATKKGKKKRGKKKAKGGADAVNRLTGTKTAAVATSPLPSHPTADETGAEHICGHKQHSRCSHITWKNDDSYFSKALAETIRELLLATPLDSKLKLELHVDMNKVKRRVDEVEAADGDISILHTKKQLPTASNKGPFSAFGKAVTPKLQRASAIHLLSTPKYYNAFLDYIEHLNYLVACGDDKAPAMADEADLVYNVVTAVYQEVSGIARSKVDAAGLNKGELGLTEGEIHEKQLAESAKKMRELQDLEQGMRRPNNPIPVTDESSKQSTSSLVSHRNPSPSSTELETKALSLIKQPGVLHRFVNDYQKMRTNGDAYGTFWGSESQLLYQKLVDMRAVPNLPQQSSSRGSQQVPTPPKDPLSPEDTINALINSTSDELAFKISYEYLTSHPISPEARQTVGSFYAADETKLSTFLVAKAQIEDKLQKSSGDAKLRKMKDEAEKIWGCILEEQHARELEDSKEVESECKPVIRNPSRTRDFVDKVMRQMVNQFAASPTGIRRFIWPLKFIAEHPSIQEKLRAAAVCVLTDMSLLSKYELFLQKVKNTPWHQPKIRTFGKLGAQQHVQLFMDAVALMKSALENAPPCVLRYNANRNELIIPLTKRAGLPIKAQICYNIRDYEFAYTAATDDTGRAAVNRDFCLPVLDCPQYFRETAAGLHDNPLGYIAFIEQKNNLANLPGCFGNAEVRQGLVSSALLLRSALAELDVSSQQDRLRIMEVVAASNSYSVSSPSMQSPNNYINAYSSYLESVSKVKTNFVREDIHYQVAGGTSDLSGSAGSQVIEVNSKDHVPYVLGKWMTDEVAAQISGKLATTLSETASEPHEGLTPLQRKIKKQLIAANYRKSQKVPLTQHEIETKARRIASDSSMLASFFQSKRAMEYEGGGEDNADEKFFLNEIKRICAEMKKTGFNMDEAVLPQEPASPESSSVPPPTDQLVARKEVYQKCEVPLPIDLPKSSTLIPQKAMKSPVHPSGKYVTVDFEPRQDVIATPGPAPIIPPGRVVMYLLLCPREHFDDSLRPHAPPLPSDTELAKEFVIFETARVQRNSLAEFYAKSSDDYDAFLEFKKDIEDAIRGIDLTADENLSTRKMLEALDSVNSRVQKMRVDTRETGEDEEYVQKVAADLVSDLDYRPMLMELLESLEHLFDDKAPSRRVTDVKLLIGQKFFERFEELVFAVHHGLFIPKAAGDAEDGLERQERTEKRFSKISRPPGIIVDNVARPFIDKRIIMSGNRIAPSTLKISADVIELAINYYPALSDLASEAIGRDKVDETKLSELEIQKVLGGLDTIPVPPQVVANLYKSGAPAANASQFTDADEAMAHLQSQMEYATGPISLTIAPNPSHSDTLEVDSPLDAVSDEYTVVPDFSPEGKALGKAMVDIQLSASKGDIPTDSQMAALGKARRELYASRFAKTTIHPNTTASKPLPNTLSVSTRAENRAAANLLARSEAVTLVGTMSFRSAQSPLKPRQTSFSPIGFPLPQPAPQTLQRPSTPSSSEPDALQMPLRASILESPIFAPMTMAATGQYRMDHLFSNVYDTREFQDCRASLHLPDPASGESKDLFSLNRVFAIYKGIGVMEMRRTEDLLENAEEYHRSVIDAVADARVGNRGLDAAFERLDEYKAYNKRVMTAYVKGQDEKLRKHNRRVRKSERQMKGLRKKLGAYRTSTIEDFEDPIGPDGDSPKLGSFALAT
ncbi:hypothetical protein V491_07100 [Pseudogymnoascus sp. VKM F-3775]|nr:hypothetical protein V491_07100 [Pseudogymnoascus sp. VKM F-3775]